MSSPPRREREATALGVEIGQLLMVALAFVIVHLPWPTLQRWLGHARTPALYGIGALAAYWTLERIAAMAI